MTPTHRELIRQAAVRRDAARAEAVAAEENYWQVVTDAAKAGASFRDLGQELGVAPATVMRHIGRKGATPRPSALDAGPPPRRRSATGTGRSS